jgi:hypothetical protein
MKRIDRSLTYFLCLAGLASAFLWGCQAQEGYPAEPHFAVHGTDTLDTHPDGWWVFYDDFGGTYAAGRYRNGRRAGVWKRQYADGLVALGHFVAYPDSAAYLAAVQKCPSFKEEQLGHWLEWDYPWNSFVGRDGKCRWNVKDGTWWYFDFRKNRHYLIRYCVGE